MSENAIITVPEERTIGVITTEIKALHAQAQQIILGYAIEIGRRLTEAKALLPHGAWGDWLRDEVSFSKSTANNFMRIFEEYGASQMGLFGPEAKSQTLGNLSYTKALKLLAIPEEERESFVEENHVEDLSSRELDRLIRERDEARKEAEDAKVMAARRESELTEAKQAETAAKDQALDEIRKLRSEADQAKEKAKSLEEQAKTARAEADKAKADAKKIKQQMKDLKENPKISDAAMEQIRLEAQKEADEAAGKKLEAQLKEAAIKQEAAEKAANEAREQARKAAVERDRLEKKLALADADTVLFKAQFEQLQETFNRCNGLLLRIEASSPETAEKLKKALCAAVDNMKGAVA